MSRSKHFCFTLNNYTPEDETLLQSLSEPFTLVLYGREVAPTTGTPHLQGYLELSRRMRLPTVLKLLSPHFHLETTKGDFYQNIKYCTKDKNFYISNPDIQEMYDLTKDLTLPEYWIDKEVYDFRMTYNTDCPMTLNERIKQHDGYIEFILRMHPNLSRARLLSRRVLE